MSDWNIRADIKESLDAYAETGRPTGGFLEAVLRNSLFDAVGRADRENIQNLQQICGYIYNELPGSCWGSYEKVRDWKEKKRAEREKGAKPC